MKSTTSAVCDEEPLWSATVILLCSDRSLPVSAAARAQWGAARLQPAPQIAGFLRVHSVPPASAQLH